MSDSNTIRRAFRDWLQAFLGTLEATTAYTQFTSKCYKELVQEGVPSAEAAVMATQLLHVHMQQWFHRRKDEGEDMNLKILQTFTPQQGQ